MLERLRALNEIAEGRGQTLSQLAVAWILNNKAVTTVLCGASRPEQIVNNVGVLDNLELTEEETAKIEAILRKGN